MLHGAASILIAAAVAATQPVPTKHPLDAAQNSAAETWVKDGLAWTKELTSMGEKLGAMLGPVFLDYLVWEGRIFVTLMNDLSKIAQDKKLTRDQPAMMKTLRAQESDENAWKAEIEAAMKAVNTAVGRK